MIFDFAKGVENFSFLSIADFLVKTIDEILNPTLKNNSSKEENPNKLKDYWNLMGTPNDSDVFPCLINLSL